MRYNIHLVAENKSSRVLTFDLLRGYFLVAIILDHLAYFPNGLDWWSGRGNLYVSAAEGFFLISGIVLGIVRGAKLVDKPFWVPAKLLLKRGLQLYITAVVLMLIFTFVGWLFIDNPGLKPGIRPFGEDVWNVIWGGMTFEYIYGWADYLRLYAVFILASPIALWLLRKKLWYVVLAISIFIWTRFQYSTLDTAELSQVYSWQLIFFSGLIIGFHWNTIRIWWEQLSNRIKKPLIVFTVATSSVTMVASFMFVYGLDLFHSPYLDNINTSLLPYFTKESLPVTRLLLAALWFSAGFWLFSRFERQIVRWIGWLLLPFGTNSLYVYTIQAFLVFFVHLIIAEETSSIILNFILSVIGVMMVWLAVRYKVLMNIIPR